MNEAPIMNELEDRRGHLLSETMSLALDDMLDADEWRRFDRHLAECEQCRHRWAIWQRLGTALTVEPFAGPAPGFVLRVDERLSRHEERRGRLLGGLVFVGGTLSVWTLLSAGVVLLFGLLLVLSPALRLQAISFLAFSGQLLALLLSDLPGLQEGLLASLPAPTLIALAVAGMLIMVLLWGRLNPAGARNGLSSSADGVANDNQQGG